MHGFKTYTRHLVAPLKIDDKEVKSITIMEPTVEMLEQIEDMGMFNGALDGNGKPLVDDGGNPAPGRVSIRQIRRTIEILSGHPEDSLKGMHRKDFEDLNANSGPLLEPSSGPVEAQSEGTAAVSPAIAPSLPPATSETPSSPTLPTT